MSTWNEIWGGFLSKDPCFVIKREVWDHSKKGLSKRRSPNPSPFWNEEQKRRNSSTGHHRYSKKRAVITMLLRSLLVPVMCVILIIIICSFGDSPTMITNFESTYNLVRWLVQKDRVVYEGLDEENMLVFHNAASTREWNRKG